MKSKGNYVILNLISKNTFYTSFNSREQQKISTLKTYIYLQQTYPILSLVETCDLNSFQKLGLNEA